MIFAGLALLGLGTGVAQAESTFHGVKRLEMHISAGQVKVTGVEGDLTTVRVEKKRYDERCHLIVDKRGDLLFVRLGSRRLFNARCEADFTVSVPQNVGMKVRNDAGDITVNGAVGPVAAETGAGKINVQGLAAPASVRTGSGSVRLAYKKLPESGTLEIRSGSGNAEVLLPRGSHVKTEFSAGHGNLKNRVGNSPHAHFKISMKSGSGDLVVNRF